jgi:hypothetical protein
VAVLGYLRDRDPTAAAVAATVPADFAIRVDRGDNPRQE